MRRFLALLFITITLGIAQGANAGPKEDAFAAYRRGDYATALSLLRPLATQGDAWAQSTLGYMYRDGQGVPQDYKEAVRLFGLAAVQGFALAQNNLGSMYLKGWGVVQDHKEAVRLYRLAADQGDAQAQNNLGLMYDNGQGVVQDYVRAHMWFNLSAFNGYSDASQYRDEVAKKLNSSQIQKAQEMAQRCQESSYKNCD